MSILVDITLLQLYYYTIIFSYYDILFLIILFTYLGSILYGSYWQFCILGGAFRAAALQLKQQLNYRNDIKAILKGTILG